MPNSDAWKLYHPARYCELLNMMKKWAVLHGDFTLTSGAKSRYLIDVKRVALSGVGHRLLGNLLLRAIQELDGYQPHPFAVAGVELGGCPLASAVACMDTTADPVDAIYVRKAKKEHGSGKLVEAPAFAPREVYLVEDVITTGGSTLRAIEALTEAGFAVQGVVAVVDREEGGLQRVMAVVPKVLALFTAEELLG